MLRPSIMLGLVAVTVLCLACSADAVLRGAPAHDSRTLTTSACVAHTDARVYPPVGLTSDDTTFSTATTAYGAGQYIASGSSKLQNYFWSVMRNCVYHSID